MRRDTSRPGIDHRNINSNSLHDVVECVRFGAHTRFTIENCIWLWLYVSGVSFLICSLVWIMTVFVLFWLSESEEFLRRNWNPSEWACERARKRNRESERTTYIQRRGKGIPSHKYWQKILDSGTAFARSLVTMTDGRSNFFLRLLFHLCRVCFYFFLERYFVVVCTFMYFLCV